MHLRRTEDSSDCRNHFVVLGLGFRGFGFRGLGFRGLGFLVSTCTGLEARDAP